MEATDASARDQFHSVRLIGREHEQAALDAVLTRALQGHGGVVLISGEAGIGKTTLVDFVCRQARRHDVVILSGHCYDLSVSPPYAPWMEIANDYRRADGWPALPAFIHDRAALDDLWGQESLFSQTWDFYKGLEIIRPLILVLEDLQWADEPSLELLRFIGRRVTNRRTLVISTYRDDELSPAHPLYRLVPALVRETNAMRVKLSRFDRVDTGELVRDRYELEGDDLERLLTYLTERAEGNPFFIDELLHSLEDEGILKRDNFAWKLGDLARAPLPSLVRQIVDSRLRKLDAATRRVLEFGAVIGETIPLDLWHRVAELSEPEFAEHLRPAIEHHILVEGGMPDRLRFGHAAIQAALYDGVVLPQRRLWHRAVAEAMMQMAQPEPNLIADHLRRAGDRRAVEWLVRAGRRAQRLYAWRISVERFEDALALLEGDDSRLTERGWICYRLGRVLWFRDPGLSRHYLDEAVRLGDVTGNELLTACALTERGHQYGLDGDFQRGLALMARGLESFDRILEQSPAPVDGQPTPESLRRGMDELRGKRISWLAAVESYDEAMALSEQILARLESASADTEDSRNEAQPVGGIANVYTALGFCHAMFGRVEPSRQAFAQARQLFRNPFARGLTIDAEVLTLTLPYLADQPGLLEESAAEAVNFLARAREGGIADLGVYSVAQTALSLLRATDWANIEDALTRAKSAHSDALWRNQSQVFLGRLAYMRGQPERAWSEIHDALPDGPATERGKQQVFTSLELVSLATDLAIDAGDLPLAQSWLECHDRWINRPGSVRGRAQGELLWSKYRQMQGNFARAREHAERSLLLAGAPRQPLALLAAHRLLGELNLQSGDKGAAEEQLSEALRLSIACGARYEHALTLLVRARLEARKGETGTVGDLLDDVRAVAGPIGAQPLLARADQLEADLNAPATRISGPAGLTGRELEVLRLVARGLTDAEVADELFVSPRTIGSHLTSIYGKLGVRSRTEATRFAVEHNLA